MKKLTSVFQKVAGIGTSVMMIPTRVFAQNWMPTGGYQGDLPGLIQTLLNTAIILAAIVAVVYLVYNGFKYMTSAGDTGKTEEAQKGIASALIGLVVCIAAAIIVNFVLGRLNVQPEDL